MLWRLRGYDLTDTMIPSFEIKRDRVEILGSVPCFVYYCFQHGALLSWCTLEVSIVPMFGSRLSAILDVGMETTSRPGKNVSWNMLDPIRLCVSMGAVGRQILLGGSP
jgi:hypothetical protein